MKSSQVSAFQIDLMVCKIWYHMYWSLNVLSLYEVVFISNHCASWPRSSFQFFFFLACKVKKKIWWLFILLDFWSYFITTIYPIKKKKNVNSVFQVFIPHQVKNFSREKSPKFRIGKQMYTLHLALELRPFLLFELLMQLKASI